MHTEDAHAESLFVADGDRFLPTELARGPWSRDALHGGPVAALVARAVERATAGDDLALVRLTLELVRPVPLAPLAVAATLSRPGRRVQLLDVAVEAAGQTVALARALRVRVLSDDRVVSPSVPEDEAPPGPDAGTPMPAWTTGYRAYHNAAMDIRFVAGVFDRPGPATAWFRLRCAVVGGEEPSPWQRVAAAADFGNGISGELVFRPGTLFINPDLTVTVHRPPQGSWVCLDARTRFGTPGVGMAESALWDDHGRIGRAVQNLLVEVPTDAPPLPTSDVAAAP